MLESDPTFEFSDDQKAVIDFALKSGKNVFFTGRAVSMIDGALFDKLEEIARTMRNRNEPFGGIQVNDANLRRLEMLPGNVVVYTTTDEGHKWALEKLSEYCPAPARVELKIGAQVMLIKNTSKQLVNGSLGKVSGFSESGLPIVDFLVGNDQMMRMIVSREKWDMEGPDKKIICSRVQIPLILAY
ncbi:hypothetical protein BC829DRAFT_490028, partial [Chytridium lagenaria]